MKAKRKYSNDSIMSYNTTSMLAVSHLTHYHRLPVKLQHSVLRGLSLLVCLPVPALVMPVLLVLLTALQLASTTTSFLAVIMTSTCATAKTTDKHLCYH
jgi:hypothetical protein